ncbi:SET domain-containing protein [Heliocybe sulcata]|uniref:SET domain-containing protein n=1 Tax=Heliocybe sulcata TaxID=5364 RepID=A0A5C3N5D8_9AGAM|nr:SET domain-containing protein [Heliocybe sulcata]
MGTASQKIAKLMKWCSEQEIEVDPRLEITTTPTGIGVRAKRDYLAFPLTLVKIPKTAVLSTRTCSLSRILGDRSDWHGYLLSLPDAVDLALFWGTDQSHLLFDPQDASDGDQARVWLVGTEVENELRNNESGEDILGDIDDYYDTIVQPLMDRMGLLSSAADYYRAYALVSSRAFLVDAYHGLSMVPIADVFDHTNENHVHLESDFDVCVSCGALSECPHDNESDELLMDGSSSSPLATTKAIRSDDEPRARAKSPESNLPKEKDNTCDMVSNRPITADTEVFNTYGERLSNASLLVRYGFMIDGNEWDAVHWTTEDLTSSESSLCEGIDLAALLANAPHLPGDTWTGSSLVYYHSVDDGAQQDSRTDRSALCLNSDGKISDRLWTLCALIVLHRRGSKSLGADAEFTQLAVTQLELEAEMLNESDADEVVSDGASSAEIDPECRTRTPGDPLAPCAGRDASHLARKQLWDASHRDEEPVFDIARLVQHICRFRMNKMLRSQDMSSRGVAEVLDDVPEGMHRTRMAMMQVINEKSLLETCVSLWNELIP